MEKVELIYISTIFVAEYYKGTNVWEYFRLQVKEAGRIYTYIFH